VKTRVTRVRRALTGESQEAVAELTAAAISSLDRAAAKGIVHRNNAARRKSRLAKRVNAALTGRAPAEPAKGTRKAASTKAANKPAAAKKTSTRSKKS
jgi:hypothetical protein